jgi:HlyD family secretion protein
MNAPTPADALIEPGESAPAGLSSIPATTPPVAPSAKAIAKATEKALAKATAKATAKAAVKLAAKAAKTPLAPPSGKAVEAPAAPVAPVAPAAPAAPVAPTAATVVDKAPATSPSDAPVKPPGQGDIAKLLAEPAARPWYRRPMLWTLVVLTLLATGGAWWWWSQKAANEAPTYNTQAAARGNLTLTVMANGTIQPTRSINIGSELSGTVLKVNVDVNDRITKGQVLVVLDTAKLRDQILRSKAAVAAANAKVAQTGATIKEATAAVGRLDAVAALSGGKVPSKAELDSGRATLSRAIADDVSARAGVSDAQAAL